MKEISQLKLTRRDLFRKTAEVAGATAIMVIGLNLLSKRSDIASDIVFSKGADGVHRNKRGQTLKEWRVARGYEIKA